MSKFRELAIDRKSESGKSRRGFDYYVYFNGDIYKHSKLIGKIYEEKILDYIFGKLWFSISQKKLLDDLLAKQPESFLERIKNEEANDLELKNALAKFPKIKEKFSVERDISHLDARNHIKNCISCQQAIRELKK